MERIINRDYIGVIKEVDGRLKYVEVDIPQNYTIIEKIEELKKDNSRNLLDVMQMFVKYYPQEEFKCRHYNYLFPHEYDSSYVGYADYPRILSSDEYQKILDDEKDCLRNKYLSSDETKNTLELLRQISNEDYNRMIVDLEKKVAEELKEYINDLRNGFNYTRFIYAHNYTLKLREIKKEEAVRMYSTDNIGWKNFKYNVNDDITIYVKSNFGYGSSSYLFCNLQYKGINILPYSDVIKYYHVQMIDFIRHTSRYGTERKSWIDVFTFAVKSANMAQQEPERFIKIWIVDEVNKMMTGIRKVMNSPKHVLEDYMKFNKEIKNGTHHIFHNCSVIDKVDYQVLPKEKVMAFKTEKITGCLLLLYNLRKLTGIVPVIVPYIEEIELMNLRILPEIETHIDSLILNINSLKSELCELKKNIKATEQIHDSIQYKEEYDKLIAQEKELVESIARRKRFKIILTTCKERIQKYFIAT